MMFPLLRTRPSEVGFLGERAVNLFASALLNKPRQFYNAPVRAWVLGRGVKRSLISVACLC